MILQNKTAMGFLSRATECEQLAKIAGSSVVAELYRQMERRWLGLAGRAEAADLDTMK